VEPSGSIPDGHFALQLGAAPLDPPHYSGHHGGWRRKSAMVYRGIGGTDFEVPTWQQIAQFQNMKARCLMLFLRSA